MPGHKRRVRPAPGLDCYAWDLTEIDGADDLHDADGILADAMARTAALYGARRCWYLVGGSTVGLLAGIRALAPFGSTVIAARNCHKAVYHAIELGRLTAHYLPPPVDTAFGVYGSVPPAAVEAALKSKAYVVGVDVDQHYIGEKAVAENGYNPFVTSAMKGLSDAAEWAIAKVYDGTWDEIGNAATSLGVAENAVGLPTATWSMENFSVADYEDLFQKVLNGDITIDNNSEMADPSTAGLSNVNVNYIGG